MKHKHADLIHAWADGAEIQLFVNDKWIDCPNGLLTFSESYEYRIKPEEKKPVVRWLWADEDGNITRAMYEYQPLHDFNIKLEWSRTEFPE